MGYAAPAQNINKSLGVMNDQIAQNQQKMDQTFANLRDMYADQIAQQEAFETAEEQKRALGEQRWNSIVSTAEAGIKGGFDENMRKTINDWGDQYYSTIGDNSPEAVRLRRDLESYPKRIAEGLGVYRAGKEAYNGGISKEKGAPGSINTYDMTTADRAMYSEGVNFNGKGLTITVEDGKLVWNCHSSVDGKDYKISNQEYINRGLEGNTGVALTGDPVAYMAELGKGVKTNIEYDEKLKVIDKSDPSKHTTELSNANDELSNAMADPALYKSALEDQTMMRSMFPGLVDKVVAASQDPNNPYHEQAKAALAGKDEEFGTADDFGGKEWDYSGVDAKYLNEKRMADENARLGQWVSDPNWTNRETLDKMAIVGFQLSTPENFYVQPKVKETILYGKTNPHGRKISYKTKSSNPQEQKEKENHFQADMKTLNQMYTIEGVLNKDLSKEDALSQATEIFEQYENVPGSPITSFDIVEGENGQLQVTPIIEKNGKFSDLGTFDLSKETDVKKLEKHLEKGIKLLGTKSPQPNIFGADGSKSTSQTGETKEEEGQSGGTWLENQNKKKNNPVTNTTVVQEKETPVVQEEENIQSEIENVKNQIQEVDDQKQELQNQLKNEERDIKAENKKQEDLMRNSEVTYGGVTSDNQNTKPLTSYKDYDFQTYLNTKEQVSDNPKIGLYGKSKHPKRGLKVDLGEDVYNGLSEGQQAMMRMQHINIPWDPRVVMLMATGDIKGADKRTEYLGDYEATTKLYNKNKAKFKNIDDQKMFDQWVDIYSRTQPNEPGYQKQYKRRVEDMAKAYGYKLTKEQLAKFKV